MLVKEGNEIEWKETARWIKFEEDVEEGGNRWSKPHVATLSLHSLFELRGLLLNGTVMLDMEANNLEVVADLVCDQMVSSGTLPAGVKDKVKDALLRRHRHQHEYAKKTRLPIIRSLADMRNQSSSKSEYSTSFCSSRFISFDRFVRIASHHHCHELNSVSVLLNQRHLLDLTHLHKWVSKTRLGGTHCMPHHRLVSLRMEAIRPL